MRRGLLLLIPLISLTLGDDARSRPRRVDDDLLGEEDGTKAAAATGVVMAGAKSARQTPIFRADHPFVWLIRDAKTGVVVFMGRVADPSKG